MVGGLGQKGRNKSKQESNQEEIQHNCNRKQRQMRENMD